MYNTGPTGYRDQQRSPSIDYFDDSSKKFKLKPILLFIFATIFLILSVAALVIVFAVEHSWFTDSFRPNSTKVSNANYTNQYGLWRLCFYANQTCESWFLTEGVNALYIDERLNQGRISINAWQALEIVYLFINASTMFIAVISLLSYFLRWRNAHYYLAILTVFCIWPAVCIGISGLFVFGFSVFNVATSPRSLEWCFYVNIASVALSLLSALFFTIYDLKLKSPKKKSLPEDRILTKFPDFLSYPLAQQPSSLVLVEKNKKKPTPQKRSQAYEYAPPTPVSQTHLSAATPKSYPMNYPPPGKVDYSFPSFPVSPSSTLLTSQMPPYQIYPSSTDWRRNDASLSSSMMQTNGEAVNSYLQRGMYRPAYLNSTERTTDEQGPMSQYLASSQGFNALDPSDISFTRAVQPAYYQTKTNFY